MHGICNTFCIFTTIRNMLLVWIHVCPYGDFPEGFVTCNNQFRGVFK